MINKARRFELKMLKYKKRLKQLGLYHLSEFMIPKKEAVDTCAIKANLTAYRSHGAPCSCSACKGERYDRAKIKTETFNLLKEVA